MSLLQPIKKSGVYSIFGKHYGDYLINFITGCCPDIGTLCTSIKHCIGIFPEGNPNLVLNQQGNWISGSGGNIQTLLSDLEQYVGAKEAFQDGKPLGYWYYNTFLNSVSQVTQYIDNYSTGTSSVSFTNNGGDDWNIEFFINPISLQVPSGVTVDSMDLTISHWVAGVENNLDNQLITTNYTYNAIGNGAGVYALFGHYNLSNGSEFQIYRIIKVDGIGNIIASLEANGIIVNYTSGLSINVTANVIQIGATYPVTWVEIPSANTVGTGLTTTVQLQNTTTSIGYTLNIDSVFTTDFQTPFGAVSTISIN